MQDYNLMMEARGQTNTGRTGEAQKERSRSGERPIFSSHIGPFVKVDELRRKPEKKDENQNMRKGVQELFGEASVAAPLMFAYHARTPVLLGWKRNESEGQVDIITSGDALVGDGKKGEKRVLNFPPGAVGQEVDQPQLREDLEEFGYWQRISGDRITSFGDSGKEAVQNLQELFGPGLSLEDGLLPSYHGPFAWFLHATPVPLSEVEEKEKDVMKKRSDARRNASNSPQKEDEEEKQKELSHELQQATSLGYWNVDIVVGAKSKEDVQGVSGMIAGLSKTSQPYMYRPGEEVYETIDDALRDPINPSQSFQCSTPALASLFTFPKEEVPGVPIEDRPAWAVNAMLPDDVPAERRITIGDIRDNNDFKAGKFELDLKTLTRHVLVVGSSGAGKSETVRGILEVAATQDVSFTIVEAVKAEHRVMGARLAVHDIPAKNKEVMVIRPGDPDNIPAGFNPLAPEPGTSLPEHVALMRSVFEAAVGGDDEGREIFKRYLNLCIYGAKEQGLTGLYEDFGWNITTGDSHFPHKPQYPKLIDLQRKMEDAIEKIRYGQDIQSNMKGFLVSRIAALRTGIQGQMLEGAQQIDFAQMLDTNQVIETEGMDPHDLSFVMGTTLIRMVEQLRKQKHEMGEGGAVPLKHILVLEEAHHLFNKEGDSDVVTRFANLLAEIRAYGVGIIIVDQDPSSIHPSALKNTSTKFMHQLPAKEDREAVGAAMGSVSEEQLDHVSTFDVGLAAVMRPGMRKPVLVQVDNPDVKPQELDKVIKPEKIIERHAGCGAECQNEVCTIRQTSKTKEFLEDTQAGRVLIGWADLSIMSELLGLGDIKPDYKWCSGNGLTEFDDMRALDKRTRECAVKDAVTKAVNGRSQIILQQFPSKDVIEHFTKKLLSELDGNDQQDESDTSITMYPYNAPDTEKAFEVLESLENYVIPKMKKDIEIDTPHPETEALEKTLGARIGGGNAMIQMQRMRLRNAGDTQIFLANDSPERSIIDSTIGINLINAIKQGKAQVWLQSLEGFLDYFSIEPAKAQYLLKRYTLAIEKTINNLPNDNE